MWSACLLSRHSEYVSIFFGRVSVHCEDLEEVCWTVWWQASTLHLFSQLTDNVNGKLFITFIFISSYLFVLPTSFLRIPKTHNRTLLQVWHANVLHFCSFCKPTFSMATSEWDALCMCVSTASSRHDPVVKLTWLCVGQLQNRCWTPSWWQIYFSPPQRLDWLWGSTSE
jgi:hypothetical protein